MSRTLLKLPDVVVGDTMDQVITVSRTGSDWTTATLTSVFSRQATNNTPAAFLKTLTPTLVFPTPADKSTFRVTLSLTSAETAEYGVGRYSGTLVLEMDGFGRHTLGTYSLVIVAV